MSMIDTCRPPELIGISDAQLQTWLTAVQLAIQELTVGGKVSTVSYAQGDGSKSVTYTQSDLSALRMRARMLAAALGLARPRRAIRPLF